MGFQPEQPPGAQRPDRAPLAERFFGEAAALTRTMLAGLPTNRALLNHLKSYRLQRI
jgi:tryptophan halogenase